MDAAQIKTEINNIRHYNVESLRSLAGIASEIRNVKNTETRQELTQLFEMVHARKVAVWSRISKRFPQAMSDNGHAMTTDEFLSIAYLCQLPEDTATELYSAHADHLNEPGALQLIRSEVNAHKPQRAKRTNGDTLADTKRLDWLIENGMPSYHFDLSRPQEERFKVFYDGKGFYGVNVREAIDSAMSYECDALAARNGKVA